MRINPTKDKIDKVTKKRIKLTNSTRRRNPKADLKS